MGDFADKLLRKGFARPEGHLGRVGGWLMARGNGPTEKHVVELAGLQAKEHVVVIGPGPGVGLRAAAKYAGVVVGVDPSETMLTAAAHRGADLVETGKVQLVQGDAADTHQPDNAVSVVLSVNNVQLWPDRAAGFAEIHRILKPGGRFVVSVHHKWAPSDLQSAATQAGFEDLATTTWEPPTRSAGTALILTGRKPLT
ncbi:methyltransferase family protein [Kribbella amoyensis]|uniref:Methyltransferase family protein n=1 Tax=Kribbella amoyensis TaxID=996641 RepID=A0A561BQS7_9ACTN|nr:class I SAM-dependent methyltransferase [Kribbella amoyensis]TWD81211.1 methyltransferase family protein [Kribbella amoyensis]